MRGRVRKLLEDLHSLLGKDVVGAGDDKLGAGVASHVAQNDSEAAKAALDAAGKTEKEALEMCARRELHGRVVERDGVSLASPGDAPDPDRVNLRVRDGRVHTAKAG